MAQALADMLTDGPISDDYEPPPVFCQKGGPSSTPGQPAGKKAGLLDLSHDSIDFMTEKVLDTLYAPIYLAFSRDAREYPSSIIAQTTKKQEIPIFISSDTEIGVVKNTAAEAFLGASLLD